MIGRAIAWATLVAGTLDILAATFLSLARDTAPTDMLRRVASGPFPAATEWGPGGAWLGLVTHFTLMAIMVVAFVFAARQWSVLLVSPVRSGVIYGLLTYVVMNLVVVPLRWPAAFPPKPISVGTQLFCHIVLVGIPIALIAARFLKARSPA